MSKDDESDEIKNGISKPQFRDPRIDTWTWNEKCKSCDVRIISENKRCVMFHPTWSNGTSTIRGTKILNNTRSYWEISISERVFGTSLMFGIGTKYTRLGATEFTNIIGEDRNSWGLSHKGILWHNGKSEKFCRPFRENFPAVIGLLFDGVYGTLTFFKDGVCLGIGFRNLQKINEPLYPIISSTSARTIMTLQATENEFINLEDRCKAVILENVVDPTTGVPSLPLPFSIQEDLMYECKSEEPNAENCDWYVSPI